MRELHLPLEDREIIRTLKVGDEVLLSGTIVTGRDAAHKYLVEEKPEELKEVLENTFLYHCGPVMKKTGDEWTVTAAGPTTSIREEPYEADVIKEYGIVGVIGKGGMGPKTLKALSEHGAVYLHAIGGLAAVLASCIKKVKKVYKLEEFGIPEAMWVFDVEKFPAVVTMDSHGVSLHSKVEAESRSVLDGLLKEY